MIVTMTEAEYQVYQNMLAAGIDGDIAFQQLLRWTTADLQVETQPEPEVVQPEEVTIEQISQN